MWQQVPSGLRDSSLYSGRSNQCYSLDGLNSSSGFISSWLFYNRLEADPRTPTSHLWSTAFFISRERSKYLLIFSLSFISVVSRKTHKPRESKFSFLLIKTRIFGQDDMIHLYLKIPENFMCLILLNGFLVVNIPLSSMVKFQILTQIQVDIIII